MEERKVQSERKTKKKMSEKEKYQVWKVMKAKIIKTMNNEK